MKDSTESEAYFSTAVLRISPSIGYNGVYGGIVQMTSKMADNGICTSLSIGIARQLPHPLHRYERAQCLHQRRDLYPTSHGRQSRLGHLCAHPLPWRCLHHGHRRDRRGHGLAFFVSEKVRIHILVIPPTITSTEQTIGILFFGLQGSALTYSLY